MGVEHFLLEFIEFIDNFLSKKFTISGLYINCSKEIIIKLDVEQTY